MRYLFGDSTESGLELNYLAFLRDMIDAAVVLVECDVKLATTDDRKRVKERDASTVIAAIEDLGKRTAHLVAPLVKEREETAVGRCATAIAIAAKDAIEREASHVRSTLASAVAAIDAENAKLRGRSLEIFDRLLKTHDLPGADRVFEVAWTSSGLKAAMRQRTAFGIEAVIALDVPPASIFTTDLRVDKIVDGVEINALEPGGWLKKSDKLVPHKLGRYHITRVVVGADVTVRVRSTGEVNASAFEITTDRDGEIRIERLGGTSTAREFSIEDTNQPKLRQLTDMLAEAARALAEHRASVVSVEVDGTALVDHAQPRAIAERLVLAIAPTVVKIARHSRSPGELVLRRMLGDDRREEIFVTTAELLKKIDTLPLPGREIFAPLQLEGDAAPGYVPSSASSATRGRPKTVPPPHPPPPPPGAKRPPPPPGAMASGQSGMTYLPGMTAPSAPVVRPRYETVTADDEIVEIKPDASSPGIPILAETQPTDSVAPTVTASTRDVGADASGDGSNDGGSIDGSHPYTRPSRGTKLTSPPLREPAPGGEAAPGEAPAGSVDGVDAVAAAGAVAAIGGDAVDPVSATPVTQPLAADDETVDEDSADAAPRKKSDSLDSLGSAIDAALDDAVHDKPPR